MYIQKLVTTYDWWQADCFGLNGVNFTENNWKIKATWNLSLWLNNSLRENWTRFNDNFTFSYEFDRSESTWIPDLSPFEETIMLLYTKIMESVMSVWEEPAKETNLLSWNLGIIGLQDWILII